VWPGRRWVADRCRDGSNVITSPEVVMRTSVVRRVGGQAPLPHTHDMEHWLRIAAASDVAYLRGVDQAWHRDHDASLSARQVSGVIDLEQRLAAFETLLHPDHRDISRSTDLPAAQAAELLADARAAIARLALLAATHALDAGLPVGAEYRPFRDLALRADPGLAGSPAVRDLDARADGRRTAGPAGRLARRARLALRHRTRARRWERSGVF